ncbi:MAG: membrane protein insertion efficiency factor YidD [Gemmataceae bacterium]|nr:membrane protein insertion efficiency factor YidD [Gemmataceae bacterium]
MIQSILLTLVRYYRRRLTGRGPFACIRCTFAKQESCSAFAERTLEQVPPRAALRRIVRRLARCRHLSLYRLADGSLAYGQAYDDAVEAETSSSAENALRRLDKDLANDGETAAVREAVRRGALRVMAQHGFLIEELNKHGPQPYIRDAAAVRRALQWRCRTRLAAAACVLVLGCLLFPTPGPALAALCCLVFALLAVSAWSAWRLDSRLEAHQVLAAVDFDHTPPNNRFMPISGRSPPRPAVHP